MRRFLLITIVLLVAGCSFVPDQLYVEHHAGWDAEDHHYDTKGGKIGLKWNLKDGK